MREGEIQVTTEQRRKMQENRKKQVINLIAMEAIDPRTNSPHPPARIEMAMEEAKVHIDPFKSPQRQMEKVVEAIQDKIPIKLARARIAIRIPSEYAGKAYGYMHGFKRVKEEWGNDGSFMAVIDIPAGLQSQLFERLNEITHGSTETKLLETY